MTATHAGQTAVAAPVLEFSADNVAPVAPEVLEAIAAANDGYAAPYGSDQLSGRLSDALASLLRRSRSDGVTVGFAVGSGVAANALALAAMTAPGGRIFCHEHAHIRVSEHGAPEHQTGCQLIAVPDDGQGKIAPAALETTLRRHGARAGSVLSLTNLTEAGTFYSPGEVAALTGIAEHHGLSVHLDGARLFNAATALGTDPDAARDALASLTWRSGIDALSLGLTKNGGMCADAVVFFEPALATRFPAKRDRAGQRSSKMRFLSAQVLGIVESDGWVQRAAHANRVATVLAAELSENLPGLTLVRPVQANHVFIRMTPQHEARLSQAGFRVYPWPRFGPSVVRLVTNWTTTSEQVRALIDVLSGAGP